jgi:hypothetical protein
MSKSLVSFVGLMLLASGYSGVGNFTARSARGWRIQK